MSRPGRRPGPAGEPSQGDPWPAAETLPGGAPSRHQPANGSAAHRPDATGWFDEHEVSWRHEPPRWPVAGPPAEPWQREPPQPWQREPPAAGGRPGPAAPGTPTGPEAPDRPQTNGATPAHGPPRVPLPGLDRPPQPAADPGYDPEYDEPPTEILRRFVPAHEVLDREAREALGATSRPAGPPTAHPPRAVVRRRLARRRMLEWPFLIVFALLSAFLIRSYAVQTFYIPSGSMHETLLEGDRVLVNKVGYHLHAVHRGDVVVFRRPPNFPVDDQDLIKRVVALPGETVEAHGRHVFVNGRPLTEPYVEAACQGTEDFQPLRVPTGHLWVMGDNRCDSSDSRVFGPIEEDLVVGRAFVLVWPPARVAWL